MKRLISKLLIVTTVMLLGLAMLSFNSGAPPVLGVSDGRLKDCPSSPNCVSTQTQSTEHHMEPVPFVGTAPKALARIQEVIQDSGARAVLVEEGSPNYLRYEFRSFLFRFVDDVEFYVDDKEQLIHFRSASRVGHSDLGANRKRMKKIADMLQAKD